MNPAITRSSAGCTNFNQQSKESINGILLHGSDRKLLNSEKKNYPYRKDTAPSPSKLVEISNSAMKYMQSLEKQEENATFGSLPNSPNGVNNSQDMDKRASFKYFTVKGNLTSPVQKEEEVKKKLM